MTLGQATDEYVVTPTEHLHEANFTMPPPAQFHQDDFASLTFHIRLDGPAVDHGFIHLNGQSFIDVPIYEAS